MPSKSNSSKKLAKKQQSKIGSIFKPFTVHGIKFKNRILAPPTIDDHSDVNGKVTPAIIKHYRTLGKTRCRYNNFGICLCDQARQESYKSIGYIGRGPS